MSLLIISLAHGMDFGMGLYDVSTPPSELSEAPQELISPSQPTSKIENIQHKLKSTSKDIMDTSNNGAVIAALINQKEEQPTSLIKELTQIKNDLFEFNTLNTTSIDAFNQSEKAEKLRKNLELLNTSYFLEIPSWPEILKENISKSLKDYYEKKLEKERKLKIYFRPENATIKTINLANIGKLPDISTDVINFKLSYPPIAHPLAEALANINYAIVKNSEDLLAKAIVGFRSTNKYKDFTVIPDFLRIKQSNILKEHILNHYIFELSQPYINYDRTFTLDTISALNAILPKICQSIPLFLEEIYKNQQSSDDDSPELIKLKSELIWLNISDLLMIGQYLKQKAGSLKANIYLIEEIVLRTKLNQTSMQACLLLLNKIGNFYPQIQSNTAKTIIDDIAANYFMLSEQSYIKREEIGLIVQAIKLLTIIPWLEPLFSEKLFISNIPHDKLEDYLGKIQLLKLNDNLSPSAKQKLLELQTKIFQEVNIRSKRALADALHAKKEELEVKKKSQEEKIDKLKAQEENVKAEKQSLEAKKTLHTTNIARLQAKEELYREEIIKLQAEEKRLKAEEIIKENIQKRIAEFGPRQISYRDTANEAEKAQRVRKIVEEHLQEKRQHAQEEKVKQTPSFFDNISDKIISWLNWLFWSPL